MCAYETNGSMASGVLRGHHGGLYCGLYRGLFRSASEHTALAPAPAPVLPCVPYVFLQLLLCRRARAVWRLLVPLALLAVPGVLFLSAAGWMVMGWFLLLWWCAAPLLGSALAWLVWAVSLRKSGRGAGKTWPEGAIIGSSEEK